MTRAPAAPRHSGEIIEGEPQTMRKTFALLAVMLTACGAASAQTAQAAGACPATTITDGTWSGSLSSSAAGSVFATMILTQSGTGIAGTYTLSNGATGTFAGQVVGAQINFNLTVTTTGCSGVLQGVGAPVTDSGGGSNIIFTYTGTTTCGGAESASGFVHFLHS